MKTNLTKIREAANKIEQLLSFGHQRLIVIDGSRSEQNAITTLSAIESSELYSACLDILYETRNL